MNGSPPAASAAAQVQVAGRKRIGFAQSAQGHVVRGPGSAARQRRQPRHGGLEIRGRREERRFADDGLREPADRLAARDGHPDRRDVDGARRREVRRRGKDPADGAVGRRQRMAERAHQPAGEPRRRRDGDLLAEDRADRQFERIPGARHAQARGPAGEHGIAVEMSRDQSGIGVEIEQRPRARGQQRDVRRQRPSAPAGPDAAGADRG